MAKLNYQKLRRINLFLNRNFSFYMRMRLVADQFKIIVFKVENAFDVRIDLHGWQRIWFAGELQFYLLDVVGIDVHIAKCVHKIARFQPGYLRHYQCEKRI